MAGPFSYDVAVIGAGIGGYVAAIRSSQLGKKVALIEKDKLGGTCLNWGCIPTKTLLATANLINEVKRPEETGIHAENVTIDFERIRARKDAVISRLVDGVNFLIRKNNIQLVPGKGTIVSKNHILIQKANGAEETIEAKNIVIAVGSEEPKPGYAEIDEERILSTRGALAIKDIPKSLAVIGGDIMGIEFAYIFKAFGSDVKIFEEASSLLPTLDSELGRTYQRILKKNDIEVHVATEVKSAKARLNGKVGLSAVSKGSLLELETDKVLIATKRRPLTRELGLEKIGVQTRDGFIVVDEHMRTSILNIYAVGDITGGKMFAHAAVAGGIVAAENIAGLGSAINYKTIPTCMYTSPEAASVGLSEDEAKQEGYNVVVGKFPLLASSAALAMGEREGFAKVVCDGESGEILGVHLIGPHATDIIAEAALAMKLECTAEELGSLIHAHPTISEALMEAARAVSKKTIHI